MWTSTNGMQIQLNPVKLLNLTEVERKTLQRVALDRITQLNIGVAVKPPIGRSIIVI